MIITGTTGFTISGGFLPVAPLAMVGVDSGDVFVTNSIAPTWDSFRPSAIHFSKLLASSSDSDDVGGEAGGVPAGDGGDGTGGDGGAVKWRRTVKSVHVTGWDGVLEWLENHGYSKPSKLSEMSRRLLQHADNPWNPGDVISLFDALENFGEAGHNYIRKIIGDRAVMIHDFMADEGATKMRIYVKPVDIIPFLMHRYKFTEREISCLVEIVSLLRLGAGLHSAGISDQKPADEDSIAKTIAKVAESVAERRQVPLPIYFNLNGSTLPAIEQFNHWIGKLRQAMKKHEGRDLFVAMPFVASTEFEWSGVILRTISEVGYTGKLWLIKPSGELIGGFDPSMLEKTPVPTEDEHSLLSVNRFPGDLIKWVEGYLGVEVSRGSIFDKVGREISPNRMILLIRKLVADGWIGGREFLAQLASGAETMTRFVETEAGGFGVEVFVSPAVLREFIDKSKNDNGSPATFSADSYVKIIDFLASLRAEWFSFMEGRKIKGAINEKLLMATEYAVAKHTGKYGVVPKTITFRLDDGEWSADKIIGELTAELAAGPKKPVVFILGPSPMEKDAPGRFLNHALNQMIADTGYKSWFVLANVDGETIYDSEAR